MRRLQADKRRIRKTNKKLIDQAKQQKKPRDELEVLHYDARIDIGQVDEDIWHLQMQYLSQQAEKYLLPIPEFKEDSGEWIQSIFTGRWRLSPDALAKLRTDIRPEQKERREYWTTLITLLIGLVGALIGFVALLKK